jgi:hypothetical protein
MSGNMQALALSLNKYELAEEEKREATRLREPDSYHPYRNDSLPNQSHHANNVPCPAGDRSAMSDMTEEEARLRQICHDNHLHPSVRDQVARQERVVNNEFNDERDKVLKKRDASIKRAENAYTKLSRS